MRTTTATSNQQTNVVDLLMTDRTIVLFVFHPATNYGRDNNVFAHRDKTTNTNHSEKSIGNRNHNNNNNNNSEKSIGHRIHNNNIVHHQHLPAMTLTSTKLLVTELLTACKTNADPTTTTTREPKTSLLLFSEITITLLPIGKGR